MILLIYIMNLMQDCDIYFTSNNIKDFLSPYLYNEIGRIKTSQKLRETFWGKFSQVTDSKPGVIPVCLLKNY